MHQPNDSLKTLQKAKYKRNVLPKSEIIQLYLNTSVGSSSVKNKIVLPKFSNNDLTTHLNNSETNQNLTESENNGLFDPKISSKEIKGSNEDNNDYGKNREKILSNLALEFILDCKQRLDSENFSYLLSILDKHDSNEIKNQLDSKDMKKILYKIFNLIKKDTNLCQKFSVFLIDEFAMEFNLVLEANQYEKTLEIFQKLELLIPNRSAFRKLLQSLISLANFSSNMDTSFGKVEYIKSKIRSATKNNALVNIDLDHLFDQRFVNIEPMFEKISLIETNLKKLSNSTDHEFIDLTLKINEQNKKNFKNFKNKRAKYSKKI